ncbi:MAG: hypothetical protein DDT25_00527 [Chloroflexi bacterium]|nr:hypothetical protein [Chloroflexota bacterium]
MSNEVFPSALVGLRYPVRRIPIWRTRVQEAESGKETRIAFWSYPRFRWQLSYEVLRSDDGFAEKQTLIDFFMLRRGQHDDFLFFDPLDSAAVGQSLGTVVGGNRTFQLFRRLHSYSMPIYHLPALPTISLIYPDQSVVNNMTNFTMGSTDGVLNGRLTIGAGTALPNGTQVLWSGSYMHRVRFDDDEVEAELFMQGMWSATSIGLVSVK